MKQPAITSLTTRLRTLIDTNHGTTRGWVRTMLAQTEYVLGRVEDHIHPVGREVDRLVFVCLGNINRRQRLGEYFMHNFCSGLGINFSKQRFETVQDSGTDPAQQGRKVGKTLAGSGLSIGPGHKLP